MCLDFNPHRIIITYLRLNTIKVLLKIETNIDVIKGYGGPSVIIWSNRGGGISSHCAWNEIEKI